MAHSHVDSIILKRVEELMLKCHPSGEIDEMLVAEGLADSPYTVRSWRKAVWKRWQEEEKENRPHHKNMWRSKLELKLRRLDEKIERAEAPLEEARVALAAGQAQLAVATTPAERTALDAKCAELETRIDKTVRRVALAVALLQAEWTKVAKVAIKLDGLDAPTVVRIEGARPDPLTMTPLERQREIAELQDKLSGRKLAAGDN